MEMADFLDTLRQEIEVKSMELSVDEYREWLREQVSTFRARAGKDYGKKIKARYNVVADFYAAAIDEIGTITEDGELWF